MIQYLGNTVVKVGRLLPWQTFTFIINRLVSVTDPTTIETALQSSADTASMPPRPPYELCMPDTKNYGQPFLVQSAELKNCNEQRDAMSRTSSSSWNVRCVQRVLTGWVISTIYCSSWTLVPHYGHVCGCLNVYLQVSLSYGEVNWKTAINFAVSLGCCDAAAVSWLMPWPHFGLQLRGADHHMPLTRRFKHSDDSVWL